MASGLDDGSTYRYSLTKSDDDLEMAAALQREVWSESGYNNIEKVSYIKHIKHSRTFAAFDDSKCISLCRIFGTSAGVLLPFLALEYYDQEEKDRIVERVRQGFVEELTSGATARSVRKQGVSMRLSQMAFKDAHDRKIEAFGVITKPDYVKSVNDKHGFTFKQLGPAVRDNGNEYAPFIIELSKKSPLN